MSGTERDGFVFTGIRGGGLVGRFSRGYLCIGSGDVGGGGLLERGGE